MYKMGNVDVLFRIMCLIAFSIVIVLVKNIITLAILSLFFFLGTFNTKNLIFMCFYLLNIIIFIICFSINNFWPFRISLIVSYLFYFMLIASLNIYEEIDEKSKKGFNKEDIRFKKSKEEDELVKKSSLDTTIYITFHFVILFLSIFVGVI